MSIDQKTGASLRYGVMLIRLAGLLLFYLVVTSDSNGLAQENTAYQSLRYLEDPEVRTTQVAARELERSSLRPGEYERIIDGGRKYLLHVPVLYDGSQPLPLLLFFHGGGGHMEQAAAAYGWREKSEKEGFLLAFPNGSSRLPRSRLATWNAGECCGYARDNEMDDIAFVKQVIDDIERQAAVDEGKIFATGMSNGGMLVYQLACEMAAVFQAVASVAGTDNTISCAPSRPISIMHIHARDDTHVLFNGGAGKDAFRDESKVTQFISVPETVDRWIFRNGADRTPRRILTVPDAYADLYTSEQNHAQVELVVTDTGGHSWPGGKSVRGNKPSRAVVANDIIWNFFMRQVRP